MSKKNSPPVKVALITGASRRIGAEIACELHAKGMNVILHYRTSQANAKELCATLNQKRSASAATLAADLSIFDNLSLLIQRAVEIWGRLDALVNNASVFYKTDIGDVGEADWGKLMDINLKAPFFLAQAAFPHLSKQQGCIVNIIDIHAERPMREYPIYCISKAGLQMLTKTLARELGPQVRVNAVSPGQMLWPEGENTLSDEIKQKIVDHIVLKRQGHPLDVAKAVSFLILDADYVTGQDLAVDGGRLLYG